jgi:hypothetical protein
VYWGNHRRFRAYRRRARSFVPVAPFLIPAPVCCRFSFRLRCDGVHAPVPPRPSFDFGIRCPCGGHGHRDAGLEVSGSPLATSRRARQENLLVSYHASVRTRFTPGPVHRFLTSSSADSTRTERARVGGAVVFSERRRWGADRPLFRFFSLRRCFRFPSIFGSTRTMSTSRPAGKARGSRLLRRTLEPIEEGRPLYDGRVWIDSQASSS